MGKKKEKIEEKTKDIKEIRLSVLGELEAINEDICEVVEMAYECFGIDQAGLKKFRSLIGDCSRIYNNINKDIRDIIEKNFKKEEGEEICEKLLNIYGSMESIIYRYDPDAEDVRINRAFQYLYRFVYDLKGDILELIDENFHLLPFVVEDRESVDQSFQVYFRKVVDNYKPLEISPKIYTQTIRSGFIKESTHEVVRKEVVEVVNLPVKENEM